MLDFYRFKEIEMEKFTFITLILFIFFNCGGTGKNVLNKNYSFETKEEDKFISAGASKLKTEKTKKIRIGIFDFNSPKNPKLSFDIPNALANAFVRFGYIDVVERKEIKKLLKEVQMGMTGLIDASTALQIGKLVSANYMLLGNIQIFGNQIRIDVRVVETETGRIVYTSYIRGNYNNLLKLEEELTEKIAISIKE